VQSVIAILFVLAFTLLIAPIDIVVRAKQVALKECYGAAFWFYALILLIGNIVAALLAFPLLAPRIQNPAVLPFIAAFAGVFAFQGVLSNTNVSFFGKGVLTIDDWIDKARTASVEAALTRHARNERDTIMRMATALQALDDDQLNTHLLNSGGATIVIANIEARATSSGANVKLYKALILATEFPDHARAIVQSRR
jgi:hypothetical protein